jgi:hypothetical protein
MDVRECARSAALSCALITSALCFAGCSGDTSARESAETRHRSVSRDDNQDNHDTGDNRAGSGAGSGDARVGSRFPSEERLCELELHRSTKDEVEALLGRPSSEERAAATARLRYVEPNGSTWTFLFDDRGIWTGINVQSGDTTTVPGCWAPDGGWFKAPDGGWSEAPDGGWFEAPDGGWSR